MASPANNPEYNWQLPAQCLLLLGLAAISLVIALCAAASVFLKKRRVPVEEQTLPDGDIFCIQKQTRQPLRLGWSVSLKALVGSICCGSGSNKWGEFESRNRQGPRPESSPVREAHGSTMSPVWQRPILMGERCELPRFSGVILYDVKGRLLQSYNSNKSVAPQDKPAAVITTLKDLL